MAEHDSKSLSTAEPERQERGRWLNNLLLLFLFVGALALMYLALPVLQAPALTNALRILLILIGGLLPAMIYNSFIQGRLPTLFAEYKQSLRRLGYPANAPQYRDKFDYGFLGAYIFGLGSLVRQYVTDDLQLRYYASLTSRYLTVFVLSSLVALLVQPGTDGSSPSADSYLLAAFVIGLFPSTGLRVAQRLGTAALGLVLKGFQEPQPLSKLDGLNAYHEDRLLLEGIENLQNMSCVKIVDLMLKTRYPVEQIVDWIDQALLHLHARDRIEDFQASGLRTATDFLNAYDLPGLSDAEKARRREDLARLLDSQPT
jgi:hypothetical protein